MPLVLAMGRPLYQSNHSEKSGIWFRRGCADTSPILDDPCRTFTPAGLLDLLKRDKKRRQRMKRSRRQKGSPIWAYRTINGVPYRPLSRLLKSVSTKHCSHGHQYRKEARDTSTGLITPVRRRPRRAYRRILFHGWIARRWAARLKMRSKESPSGQNQTLWVLTTAPEARRASHHDPETRVRKAPLRAMDVATVFSRNFSPLSGRRPRCISLSMMGLIAGIPSTKSL